MCLREVPAGGYRAPAPQPPTTPILRPGPPVGTLGGDRQDARSGGICQTSADPALLAGDTDHRAAQSFYSGAPARLCPCSDVGVFSLPVQAASSQTTAAEAAVTRDEATAWGGILRRWNSSTLQGGPGGGPRPTGPLHQNSPTAWLQEPPQTPVCTRCKRPTGAPESVCGGARSSYHWRPPAGSATPSSASSSGI